MREIKFRDYDLETKEMRYFPLEKFDDNTHDQYGNIMQWTGETDKNRKEIYEGDIVSVRSGSSKSIEVMHEGEKLTAYKSLYNIAVIVFYKSAYGLHKTFDTKPHETTQYNGTTYFGTLQSASWDIEVIGNIYETPELLTGGEEK